MKKSFVLPLITAFALIFCSCVETNGAEPQITQETINTSNTSTTLAVTKAASFVITSEISDTFQTSQTEASASPETAAASSAVQTFTETSVQTKMPEITEAATLIQTVPEATQTSTEAPVSNNEKSVTVYITKTGNKYHNAGCRYLSKSCIAIDIEDAVKNGYTKCSRC